MFAATIRVVRRSAPAGFAFCLSLGHFFHPYSSSLCTADYLSKTCILNIIGDSSTHSLATFQPEGTNSLELDGY